MCDQLYFTCDDCHRSTSGYCWRHPQFHYVNVAAGAAAVQQHSFVLNANGAAVPLSGVKIWWSNNAGAAPMGQTYRLNIGS